MSDCQRESAQDRLGLITGVVGLLGAALVGGGQLMIQVTSLGNQPQLSMGHYIAVYAAPLYVAGYFHVYLAMKPAPAWQRLVVLLAGGYAFAIGAQWLGSQVYLALITQAHGYSSSAAEATIANLLVAAADQNEPLLAAHEAGVLIASIMFMFAVLGGRTAYPRWMAACSPMTLLAATLAIGAQAPVVGKYLMPAAMNIAHVVFFALSMRVWTTSRRASQSSYQEEAHNDG